DRPRRPDGHDLLGPGHRTGDGGARPSRQAVADQPWPGAARVVWLSRWRRSEAYATPPAAFSTPDGSRQVHVHPLDLGVQLQGVLTELAADAAHLESAERGRGVEDVVAVDPDRAGPQAVRQPVRLADVARPHRRGQAVERPVAALDHLVDVLELEDVHH